MNKIIPALKKLALSIVATGVAFAAVPGHAADMTNFDIPPGELASALKSLAKQTGLELIFQPGDLKGMQTQGVKGNLSPQDAVTRLISGTKLTVTTDAAGAILIAPPRSNASVTSADNAANNADVGSEQVGGMRLAQSENPQNQFPASEGSKSPVSAETGDNKIQEIIVTAQKRAERLADTPISIGVLSGAELDRRSSRGLVEVLNQIGGVTATEFQPGETQIFIRGMVPGAGASTVAYYQDEVPFSFVSSPQLPDANAFDLTRVEVLRGPQGTLYGANALSGAVRIITNDADLNSFGVKGRTRASSTDGSGGNYAGDVALNVPLIPGKLAIRGVAGYSEMSGFIRSALDGVDRINDSQAKNYRFKVNYRPTENLSAKLGYSRSEIDNGANSRSLADFITPFGANQPDSRVLDLYSLIAEYQWAGASLVSATGYVDYETATRSESILNGVRQGIINALGVASFSQELRLSSNASSHWRWSAGAFYKDTKQLLSQEAKPSFPFKSEIHRVSESYAGFADVTRAFGADRFELTGGVRYFNDQLSSSQPASVTRVGGFPDQSSEYDRVTGRLVFAFKPHQGLMGYGSVSTGFRSGLQQTASVVQMAPGLPNLDPDSQTTYELGLKGVLAGGALSYESAVYFMEWQDIQQSLILPSSFAAFVNAGDASGLGADMGVAYQVTRALSFNASIGWNDLKLDKNVVTFDTVNRLDIVLFKKDARPNDSPAWTGSVGADYRVATPKAGLDLVFSGNFAYGSKRSERFLTAGVVRESQSEDLRSLKAAVGLENDRWSLRLYGDNVLNDDSALTAPTVTGANITVHQRPRTIGLQVGFEY